MKNRRLTPTRRHSAITSTARAIAADGSMLGPVAVPARRQSHRRPRSARRATTPAVVPVTATPAASVTPSTTTSTTTTAEPTISARVRRAIDTLRAEFRSQVERHVSWQLKREELCKPFMRAWLGFQKDTGLTFADYVRQYDASVPADRAGYKRHSAYRAAEYLSQLYRQQERAKAATNTDAASTPKRLSALDAVARITAAMLPLISADQIDRLFDVMKAELHWTDAQVKNLRTKAQSSDPLIAMQPPRGFSGAVPQLRIAAPTHTPEAGADATSGEVEQSQPRTGTHG